MYSFASDLEVRAQQYSTASAPTLKAAGWDINNIAANNVYYIYQGRRINTPSALAGAAVGFAAGYVVGDEV